MPEVLPDDMIRLAKPDCDDLVAHLVATIERLDAHDPLHQHERVRRMYKYADGWRHTTASHAAARSWRSVAERTEVVYERIMAAPNVPLLARFKRCDSVGGMTDLRLQVLRMWFGRRKSQLCGGSMRLFVVAVSRNNFLFFYCFFYFFCFALFLTLSCGVCRFLEWFDPRENIDIAPDFPQKQRQ